MPVRTIGKTVVRCNQTTLQVHTSTLCKLRIRCLQRGRLPGSSPPGRRRQASDATARPQQTRKEKQTTVVGDQVGLNAAILFGPGMTPAFGCHTHSYAVTPRPHNTHTITPSMHMQVKASYRTSTTAWVAARQAASQALHTMVVALSTPVIP